MIFYCPSCWAYVRENEKVCPECGSEIERLDQRTYPEKLMKALSHPERTTRIRAAYFLGTLGDPRAIHPFAEIVYRSKGVKDIFLVETIANALGEVKTDEAVSILVQLMEHPSFLVRRAALNSLKNFKNKATVEVIRKALKDPSPSVQELAQRILESW